MSAVGQEKYHLQGVGERRADRRGAVSEDELRERRQGDRPYGDAEKPQRQVSDPEGVVELADDALGQRRDQDRVDQDVDPRPGEADRDRDEQGHDPPGIPGRGSSRRGLQRKPSGAEERAPGRGAASARRRRTPTAMPKIGPLPRGHVPAVGQERHEDRKEVERGRGHRRHEERPLGVEIAHGPGGQADEDQEGEEDRGQAGPSGRSCPGRCRSRRRWPWPEREPRGGARRAPRRPSPRRGR
ncbi:MAG: hypothetical protein MZV63_65660 [Marinilabiliales bacterium]|nr:hypothetical protein [Marinilabiliales bacterium]